MYLLIQSIKILKKLYYMWKKQYDSAFLWVLVAAEKRAIFYASLRLVCFRFSVFRLRKKKKQMRFHFGCFRNGGNCD